MPAVKDETPYIHAQFSVVMINPFKIKIVTPYQILKTFSALNLQPVLFYLQRLFS